MDINIIKAKIKNAQRDLTAASLWLEDAFVNYHYKRGQLAAYECMLQVAENKIEKNIESQN